MHKALAITSFFSGIVISTYPIWEPRVKKFMGNKFGNKLLPSVSIIEYIKEKEGLRLQPYKDDFSGTTEIEYAIGYGHQIQPFEKELMSGIDKSKANELLDRDLKAVCNAIYGFVNTKLNQNQFDALVSFIYNVGENALKNSSLLSTINANVNNPLIKDKFLEWVNSQGKINAGLVERRKYEADLFFA